MTENEEIQKEVLDLTKMPEDVRNKVDAREHWINDETARIENEYDAKIKEKGGTTETPAEKKENKEEPIIFNPADFEEHGVKTLEEVKEALKQGGLTKQERDALKAERDALQAERDDFKAKYESKPKTIPIDKTLYRLNEKLKQSPEEFEKYTKLLYGKSDPMEILKESFIKDNPEYKDNPMLEDIIKGQYFPDDWETLDPEVPADKKKIDIANAKMDIAAKAAKQKLLSELDKIDVPEAEYIDEKTQKEAEEKAKEKTRKDWQPIVAGLPEVETLKKFKIQLPDKDESGHVIKGKFVDFAEYEAPESVRKQCAEGAQEYIVNNKLEPTKENLQHAFDIMMNGFILQNLPYIIDAAVEKRGTMDADTFHKTYDKPSGGKKETKPPAKDERTEGQKAMADLEKQYVEGR